MTDKIKVLPEDDAVGEKISAMDLHNSMPVEGEPTPGELIATHRLQALEPVYTERNALAAAFARLTIQTGGKAGWGWDINGYKVLYVNTPNGQVSWHFWEVDHWLLEGIPKYDGVWDGDFKGRDPKWAVWK